MRYQRLLKRKKKEAEDQERELEELMLTKQLQVADQIEKVEDTETRCVTLINNCFYEHYAMFWFYIMVPFHLML